MFDMFDVEYEKHDSSYDENHMRDFTDVYIQERRRANSTKDTGMWYFKYMR